MRWKRSKDHEGDRLDDIINPEEFPAGGTWVYSSLFVKVDVILSHGFLPSQFGICSPEEDLIFMMAHNNRKVLMARFEENKAKQK